MTFHACLRIAATLGWWSFAIVHLPAAAAGPAEHRLGDHPAIVVQRLAKTASYDYASRFYPHPAWLYLRPGPSPDEAPEAVARSAAPAASAAPVPVFEAAEYGQREGDSPVMPADTAARTTLPPPVAASVLDAGTPAGPIANGRLGGRVSGARRGA